MTLIVCHSKAGPPYTPKESLSQIAIEKGFRIELFANEPLISSPVAMEFDENGRIFVVEMPGYPLDTRPTGRVVLLEDTDGDGRPDRRRIFADQLTFPTGVMRWKRGVLVTAAPDVIYFEDVDGDGKADTRQVVLTGFPQTNPQHLVNGPLYGLDNWVYLANEGPARAVVFADRFGDLGSDIRFPDYPAVPALKIHDHSVRFRPDTHQLESLSGASQFGHGFDDWGHYFTLDNENQGRHEVIAARYLQRNPNLPLSSAEQDMSDHENAARVFPITQHPSYQLLSGIGTLTSACSFTLYQGGAFPTEYNKIAFVAEPAQNLVHCDVLNESGSTFVASRLRESVEFLASTDSWFRPVGFFIGPDGALYLIDYYRQLIEHPEWTSSKHHHDSKDLYLGSDRGRIYRIVPESNPLPLPKNVNLGAATPAELVHHLSSPNIWWRRNAQRLLVDRKDPESFELLARLVREGRSPLGRLHALGTLGGLRQIEASLIQRALSDPVAGVRENAIRLAESQLSSTPTLVDSLLKLAPDPNPRVRFQLLCTLGSIDNARSRAVQEKLLLDNIEDKWMQIAALSASSDRAPQLFDFAISPASRLTSAESPGRRIFLKQVCAVLGARQKSREIGIVLKAVGQKQTRESTWWQTASLEGLAQGSEEMAQDHFGLKAFQDPLLALFHRPEPAIRQAALRLLKWTELKGPRVQQTLQETIVVLNDPKQDPQLRADAIEFMVLAGAADSHEASLEKLIDPQQPEPVQAAAVKALGKIPGQEVGIFLLSRWRTLTAPVRNEAARALESNEARCNLLLDAIQNDTVQSWTLTFRQKSALIMNRNPEIRARAHALLESSAAETEQVLKKYQTALDIKGDPIQGEKVFKNVCAKCHKKNGVGKDVGPDLGTVQNRPAALILEDILIPSKSIAQKYEAYVVETYANGMHEGVLGVQTPEGITLKAEEGKETQIARHDIKRMYVANLSAMPADLQKQIDVQQMANLLKFLTTAH